MFVKAKAIVTLSASKNLIQNRIADVLNKNLEQRLCSLQKIHFVDRNVKYCVDKKDMQHGLQKPSVHFKSIAANLNLSNNAKKILNSCMSYMEEVSHLDDVRKAQEKVMFIKDKLKESGDEKRRLLNELNTIRQDIQKNHNEIATSNRGTERYVSLVTVEMNLLKNETNKQIEFNTADEVERQHFNTLTAAINDSYEKEKVHSNFIKILGLMGTLAASVVTLIASAIGHFYHNTKFGLVAKDFKQSVTKTIKDENSSLKDVMRLEIQSSFNKQDKILKRILYPHESKKESWSGYFSRHLNSVYYYFIPKKN